MQTNSHLPVMACDQISHQIECLCAAIQGPSNKRRRRLRRIVAGHRLIHLFKHGDPRTEQSGMFWRKGLEDSKQSEHAGEFMAKRRTRLAVIEEPVHVAGRSPRVVGPFGEITPLGSLRSSHRALKRRVRFTPIVPGSC